MKAIVLKEFGGVENLTLSEVSTPGIKREEVLVKVKAISINPVDVKTRAGTGLAGTLKDQMPVILGWDISGEVVEAGAEVSAFKPGDAVFGMANFPGHGKAYAEYVAVPAAHLAAKPATISHQQAAAATLAALTAWQGLVTHAGLKPGQKILIHAAAGGVGHYAVQLAKKLGAYVIGTSSVANREFVLSLGADEHLDYGKQRFEEVVQDADVVLETVGGANKERSLQSVKKGGTLVSILGGLSGAAMETAKAKGVKVQSFLVSSNGEEMQQLARLLGSGQVKSHVSLTLPFEQMREAHKQVESGKTRGKVVVTLE